MVFKFCTELDRILKDPKFQNYRIYHYCLKHFAKKTNAAFLIGAFIILVLDRTARDAWETLSIAQPFADFRDASQGPCRYKCNLLHCLRGLEKAVSLGWFDIRTFDCQEYEYRERVENGDFNWIIPGKFLAFSNPGNTNNDHYGFHTYTPEDYIPIFNRLGVTSVVRLNNRTYDENRFKLGGINHYDLFFTDGSVPSPEIVDSFLKIAETEQGALAVHCKAGLGRTGTLIAIYAMKHYGFDAAEFIAWNRICRPGSVLGPQQQFLVDLQNNRNPVLSSNEDYIAINGDYGQANRLMAAKKSNQNTPDRSPGSPITNSPSPFKAQTRAYSNGPNYSPSRLSVNQTPTRNSPAKSSIFSNPYRSSPGSRHSYGSSAYNKY